MGCCVKESAKTLLVSIPSVIIHLKNEHFPSGDSQINQLRTSHSSIFTFDNKRNRKRDEEIDQSHPSQRSPYSCCRDKCAN